jgi:hypothetical protein
VTGAANTGAFHAAANNNTWTGGSNSGTMDRTGGNLTIAGGFTNTGTVTGASISGSVTNTSGILNTVSLNDVTLTGGTLQGTNTAAGTNSLSNFANAGTLNVNSGNTTLSGTVDGGGAINVGAPATLVLSNGTQFDGGGLTVNGGTVAVQGTVDPLDTFTLNGGTLNLDGTFEVDNAYLNSGIVTGTGSFGSDTNLYNSGVDLYVGGDDTIGQWTLGSYFQSGTGSLNFDILNEGQDWLTLTNGGTLNGNVSLNFDYSGPLKHFTLISGLQGNSSMTFGDLPTGWTYSLTNGTLSLNASSVPDPPTVMLIGGALAVLGSLRRRMKKKS